MKLGRSSIGGTGTAGSVGKEGVAMREMKSLQGFDWVKDWPTWRTNVKERIALAHRFGVPDETLKTIAVKVGDFLADKVCPATQEDELLKEMWSAATPDERKTIATVIFKMVG
jgi:hypothetical protein